MRELSERGTTLRWTWGEISTSPPLKSPKTLITLSETTRAATLDPELEAMSFIYLVKTNKE